MKLRIKSTVIGRKKLFDTINLEIPENTITVITGKNGTGKTIFLRRLFDAYKEAGVYPIFVEQGNEYLFSHANILENVCLSGEKEDQEMARKFLAKNSMQYLEMRKPDDLSGGEKRLICIMRAVYFADKADVLILDEPSNDLDYIRVRMLINLFNELKAKCTIVIVTHDDRISAIADQCMTIAHGQIKIDKAGLQSNSDESRDTLKKPEINREFMNRILAIGHFTALFVLILCMTAIYCINISANAPSWEEQNCVDNEVDFINPVSNYGEYAIVTDALPIAMMKLFDDELSAMEKLSIYNELESTALPVNYGMSLENGTDYCVIELEYYDPLTKIYYYPIDLYREMYGIDADIDIDTSEYFYVEGISGDTDGVLFDLEKYYICRDKLLHEYDGVNLECTYMVVVLSDEITFLDFIDFSEVENLSNGNFYIRSKETGALLSQMKIMQSQIKSLSLSLILSILTIAMYFLVVGMALHIKRKAIVSFCNINIERKQIISALKKKMGIDNISVGMVFLTVPVAFALLWQRDASGYVGNYFSLFVLIASLFLINRGVRIIISLYTKHIWSWKRR